VLLKVGELARHTGLTVRTLHHCDAIGLLAPSARCKDCAAAGPVCFTATLVLLRASRGANGSAPHQLPHAAFWIAFACNAAARLWSFALIGGFLRYLPRQNAAFVALASYQLLVRRTRIGTLLNGQRADSRSTRKSTKTRVFAAR
jgi:hypothetical protein